MEKETLEITDDIRLENDAKRDSIESNEETRKDSTEIDKIRSENPEFEQKRKTKDSDLESEEFVKRILRNTSELKKRMKRNSSESEKRAEIEAPELEMKFAGQTSELKEGISKMDAELPKRKGEELMKRVQGNASKLEGNNSETNAEFEKRIKASEAELEKMQKEQKSNLRKSENISPKEGITSTKEFKELVRRSWGKNPPSEKEYPDSKRNSEGEFWAPVDSGSDDMDSVERNELQKKNVGGSFPDETIQKVDETGVPLLVGDSVSIDMGTDGSPKVHVHGKKKEAGIKESLSPIRRMSDAWETSSNIGDFILRAFLIVFASLGWLLCVGGLPFVSIAMIAIGCIYKDSCTVQPMIPIYLIVGGACGTVQHFIALWNKYIPEETQGKLKAYRLYYSCIDGTMSLFLFIWFILGCVWVYGVKEVGYTDEHRDDYCHKTLYLFSFWLLNMSFIIIALVVVLSLCTILCVAATQ